jgi:hypothetical protein
VGGPRDCAVQGEVVFLEGQTDRIGNIFDATDASLDDTTGQDRGKSFHDLLAPDEAGGGTAVSESGHLASVDRQRLEIPFQFTFNKSNEHKPLKESAYWWIGSDTQRMSP